MKKEKITNTHLIILYIVLGIIIGSIGTSLSSNDTSLFVNNNNAMDSSTNDHSTHLTHDHSETHSQIELDPILAPTLSIDIIKDKKAGWLLKLNTMNFQFTPEDANTPHVDNQGHAHLYIDGEKITRLYSNYYYLSDLPKGKHEIKVTLNSNNHEDFTLNGEIIESTKTITQK